MFTRWITKDYLLVNISMLRLENLDKWILEQMPEVENLEFYCDLERFENLLPSHRGQKNRWERFNCKYQNISGNETKWIEEKMSNQIPTKPTIAFLQINR